MNFPIMPQQLQPLLFKSIAEVSLLGQGKVAIGGVDYVSDLTKTYLQIKLVNTYPTVNANRMTFTYPLLASRFPTSRHQPLNLDHQMDGNPPEVFSGDNLVVGATLASYVGEVGAEGVLLPESPVPGIVIGVVWNRTAEGQKVIASLQDGAVPYQVSFEVIREPSEDGYIVIGEEGHEYQPFSEELAKKWIDNDNSIVALAVGGDGSGSSTYFWGGAFTMIPADDSTEISPILTASLNGQAAIAANMDISPVPPLAHYKTSTAKSWAFSESDKEKLLGDESSDWKKYFSVHAYRDVNAGNSKEAGLFPLGKISGGSIKWSLPAARIAIVSFIKNRNSIPKDLRESVYDRILTVYELFGRKAPKYNDLNDMTKERWVLSGYGENQDFNNQEVIMDPFEKLQKLLAEAGFDAKVQGRNLKLTIAGQEMVNPNDFYLSAWKGSDGEYHLAASLTAQEPGIDGFKEDVRYEYDPESGDDQALQETDTASVLDLSSLDEDQARHIVMAFRGRADQIIAEVEAKYKDYVSPEEVQSRIDAAVAAGVDDNDGGNTMDEKTINKLVDDRLNEHANDSEKIVSRVDAATAAGVEVTDERRNVIAAFTADDAGEKAFHIWLADTISAQKSMILELEKSDVVVDENVTAAIAPLNGPDTPAFQGLKKVLTANVSDSPSTFGLGSALGSNGNGVDPSDLPYM